jgi:N-acetylglucosamine-6-phosphate deacetylase
MENWLLHNGRIVRGRQIIQGDMYISAGEIQRFFITKEDQQEKKKWLEGRSYRTLDCQDALIGPGFIDIHVHGGGGADVMDATIESFETMAYTHGQRGTTRFLLTTVTASHEDLIQVSQAAKKWSIQLAQEKSTLHSKPHSGALPLGIHLEGPYIAAAKKGAQNGAYIRPFSMKEFEEYQKESNHMIKLITLAPEKLDDLKLITQLNDQGVVVSIGHTEATYDEAEAAFQHGATHVTHLCNAMPGIHHRSPGLITYALNHDGLTVEFIPDGLHVHPAIIQLALRAKKVEDIAIVTDAIRATGMGDGKYQLGGLPVNVEAGKATLENGTLAGSCLDMEAAFQFLKNELLLDEIRLFQLMSGTPAKILGISDQLGSLEIGKVADVVIFREERLTDVMIDGNWVKGGHRE